MDEDGHKVVLTGGPCGGKTTGISYLQEKFSDMGFSVICVSETATEVFKSGVQIGKRGLTALEFQEQLLLMQIEKEERYLEITRRVKNPKKTIFFDRGIMDQRAYLSPREFKALIESKNLNIPQLRDKRYDGVFHLVTAASGAEEFYTLENNSARLEKTLEEARNKDKLTLDAWVGHPHLRVIDNSTDFEGKMRRLRAAICRVVGIPTPLEIERKFLVEMPDVSEIERLINGKVAPIDIEQIYLLSDGKKRSRRIRKRGQNGHYVYYQTEKRRIRPSVRIETERRIDVAAYNKLSVMERDIRFSMIKKTRNCFIWNSQYFELDVFHQPKKLERDGVVILEIELTEENEKVEIPPFIKVIKEVTDDSSFTNKALARYN